MSVVTFSDGVEPVAQPTSRTAASRFAPITRQAGSFASIGLVSSVANAALYLTLRQWWSAEAATVVAVTLTTLMSTEANRRVTFAEARTSCSSLVVQNLVVIAFYCSYNTMALWVLHQVVTAPSTRAESLALLVASSAGGVARFVLLRAWVFRGRGAANRALPGPGDIAPRDIAPGNTAPRDTHERPSRIGALMRPCRAPH